MGQKPAECSQSYLFFALKVLYGFWNYIVFFWYAHITRNFWYGLQNHITEIFDMVFYPRNSNSHLSVFLLQYHFFVTSSGLVTRYHVVFSWKIWKTPTLPIVRNCDPQIITWMIINLCHPSVVWTVKFFALSSCQLRQEGCPMRVVIGNSTDIHHNTHKYYQIFRLQEHAGLSRKFRWPFGSKHTRNGRRADSVGISHRSLIPSGSWNRHYEDP